MNYRRQITRFSLTAILGCFAIGLLASEGALARPCPPTLAGAGGPNCGIDAEQDWLYRSTLPGVQWAHNFASDDEITRFIWVGGYGDDPGRLTTAGQAVEYNTSDYVSGGGSLIITNPAGLDNTGGWIRPLAPLEDSGRGVPDKGWNTGDPTTLTIQGDGTRLFNWLNNVDAGGYGPESVPLKRQMFLQYQAKFDSRREFAAAGGKIHYLTMGDGRVVSQELVHYYKGGTPLEHSNYQGSGFSEISSTLPSVDIEYGEWQTFLFQLVAGDEFEDLGSGPGTELTQLRAWRQRPGETEYTKIWENNGFKIDYQNAYIKTINALIFNHLLNSINNPQDVDLQIDEVILSDSWIPPKSTF